MRAFFAFVIAPLVPVSLLCSLAWIDQFISNENRLLSPCSQFLTCFTYGAIVAYFIALVVGVPAHVLLHRTRFNNLTTTVCLTSVSGAVIGSVVPSSIGSVVPIITCCILGSIGGLSFWYINRGFDDS